MDGANDQGYERRRAVIASLANGPQAEPAEIDYLESEDRTWEIAKAALDERWITCAADEILTASGRLGLPNTRVPQLSEVSRALEPRSGFSFRALPGLVSVEDFFGSLAHGKFLSTQYIRSEQNPHYTPEPDVIHEVVGHGTCLADPALAMLHRQAGAAMQRLETDVAKQFVADVFWFSAEFGVLLQNGEVRAYGAGILSSVAELDSFRGVWLRPLDVIEMGTTSYEIDKLQQVLFVADSMAHVMEVVGEFFVNVSDDEVAQILAQSATSQHTNAGRINEERTNSEGSTLLGDEHAA